MRRFVSRSVSRFALVLLALAACHGHEPAPPPMPVPAVAAGGSSAAPAAPAPGRTQTIAFHSAALGVDKQAVVYLPASYDRSPARHYPVFYYLHGLGGNETNWVRGGHLDAAADQLGLDAIVVMPDGDDDFYIDSAEPIDYDACMSGGAGLFVTSALAVDRRPHECVRTRDYETYITRDLVGYIDGHYRTISTRNGRAIAGLSMGGYGALMLAGRHPDLFAAAASHSGVDSLFYAGPYPYDAAHVQLLADVSHWPSATAAPNPSIDPIGSWVRGLFGRDKAFWAAHDPVALLTALGPGKVAIYIDCGTEDDFHLDAHAAYLHDQLTAAHIDHAFFLGPGRHNFAFWGPRIPESLRFLRDHTTAAH